MKSKKLISLGVVLLPLTAVLMSGCASMGAILKGAGGGLQNASRQPIQPIPAYQPPPPQNCTTQINKFTNTATTTCY